MREGILFDWLSVNNFINEGCVLLLRTIIVVDCLSENNPIERQRFVTGIQYTMHGLQVVLLTPT